MQVSSVSLRDQRGAIVRITAGKQRDDADAGDSGRHPRAPHADLESETTARAFGAEDTLRLFVPVFWSGKDQSAAVTVSLRRGTQILVERRGPATVLKTGDRRQASFEGTLPVTGLTAGPCLLEIEARLPGGQTARRGVAIEIR